MRSPSVSIAPAISIFVNFRSEANLRKLSFGSDLPSNATGNLTLDETRGDYFLQFS
jgi:hypothetical protein